MTDFEAPPEVIRMELEDEFKIRLNKLKKKIKEKHHEWRLNKLSGYYLDDSFDYILDGIMEEYLNDK